MMKNQNSTLIEDEGTVVEELDLIARINQDDDGQLLKIFKDEEEYAELKLQHTDDVRQVQNEWLKCLLETIKKENEIPDTRVKMLEAVKRIGADTSLQKFIMLTITQGEMNE